MTSLGAHWHPNRFLLLFVCSSPFNSIDGNGKRRQTFNQRRQHPWMTQHFAKSLCPNWSLTLFTQCYIVVAVWEIQTCKLKCLVCAWQCCRLWRVERGFEPVFLLCKWDSKKLVTLFQIIFSLILKKIYFAATWLITKVLVSSLPRVLWWS